jgi:hypothetical protein
MYSFLDQMFLGIQKDFKNVLKFLILKFNIFFRNIFFLKISKEFKK